MADIKLIIKISEDSYKATCNGYMLPLDVENVVNAIKNGTTLPKGHGRIGDLDAIMSDISTSINEMTNIGISVDGEYLWAKLNDAIYNAPTIIEADKAESEDNE